MKKVYIPTDYEMQQLKYLGFSPYYYLLAKTVETLIMEDIIYEDIDMFDYIYEDLTDIKEVLYSIAQIYPEKIASSEIAAKDIDLCRMLMQKISHQRHIDNSIYQLDTLTYFNQESDIIKDSEIIKTVSSTLADRLTTNPRYRFEYKEPNALLDNIFSCELPYGNINSDTFGDLISIDPIYITKLGLDLELEKRKISQNKGLEITRGIARYKNRYYIEQADTSNQQQKIKKLMKCLEKF